MTEDEKANLQMVAQAYKYTVLVVNACGQIDLSCIDDIPGIDALVFHAQAGMEGGKFSFCGKLADTWAMEYEDIPGAMEYGCLNDNLDNEFYCEGVFVGYRCAARALRLILRSGIYRAHVSGE